MGTSIRLALDVDGCVHISPLEFKRRPYTKKIYEKQNKVNTLIQLVYGNRFAMF